MNPVRRVIKYTEYAKYMLLRRSKTPFYFVFFITNNCNCTCKHCLLGKRHRIKNELTLEEIEKISKSMGNIMFLLITGGEPFLRKDLPEIVEIFYKNNNVQNLGIPTNGSLKNRVLESSERILKKCPELDFAVDISIDGIGKEHDELRGVPGLFEKSLTTYKKLEKLKKEYKNFNLNIGMTISHYNQDKLSDALRYLHSRLGINTVNYLLVRGEPRDERCLDVDPEKYERFGEELEDFEYKGLLTGYKDFPYSDFVNAIRRVRRKIIYKIIKSQKRDIPCFAANFGGVLKSNGELFACELLDDSLGNLRDCDYDFAKVWGSKKVLELQKKINKDVCVCTYECFLTISVFFLPSLFTRVFIEWVRMKLKKAINLISKKHS